MPDIIKVSANDDGMRLDKWFKKNRPEISYVLVQKLLRKGAIKLDGKKAKGEKKITKGQEIRIPDIDDLAPKKEKKNPATEQDAKNNLIKNIIYEDKNIFAINKPPGLPSQGGTKVKISVDDMLEYLQEGEKPKLVHRIDKDTSGVMLLAKNKQAAQKMTAGFKDKDFKKIYWAVVVGTPDRKEGIIDLPILAKSSDGKIEKSIIDDDGKKSITYYKVIESAAKELSWVAMMPVTGRMHQLRVHMEAIGHPILGDGKYGGREAFIDGLSKKMHLHARSIMSPFFSKGIITAPIPKHMKDTFKLFGFDENIEENPFEGLD